MLIDARQKKQATTEQALDAERQHAADLAHQVDNLKDLIAKLESESRSGRPRGPCSARAIEQDATRPDARGAQAIPGG